MMILRKYSFLKNGISVISLLVSQVENFSLGLEEIVVVVKLHILAIDLWVQSWSH